MLGHFHVLRLNVVEHMVFLRAPVLAHQADELRGGEPADVLLQLLPPAPPWGGRQVSQGSTWLSQLGSDSAQLPYNAELKKSSSPFDAQPSQPETRAPTGCGNQLKTNAVSSRK